MDWTPYGADASRTGPVSSGQERWYYNAADEPHPPATGWKGTNDHSDVDGRVRPVLRSWLEPEEWERYEEQRQVAEAMESITAASGAGALVMVKVREASPFSIEEWEEAEGKLSGPQRCV